MAIAQGHNLDTRNHDVATMNDTWLITLRTTSPVDALLLAFAFEGCTIECAARSSEAVREAQPRPVGRLIGVSMIIPPELRVAVAANDGWPES